MSRLRWPDSTNSVSEKPGTIQRAESIDSSANRLIALNSFMTTHSFQQSTLSTSRPTLSYRWWYHWFSGDTGGAVTKHG